METTLNFQTSVRSIAQINATEVSHLVTCVLVCNNTLWLDTTISGSYQCDTVRLCLISDQLRIKKHGKCAALQEIKDEELAKLSGDDEDEQAALPAAAGDDEDEDEVPPPAAAAGGGGGGDEDEDEVPPPAAAGGGDDDEDERRKRQNEV